MPLSPDYVPSWRWSRPLRNIGRTEGRQGLFVSLCVALIQRHVFLILKPLMFSPLNQEEEQHEQTSDVRSQLRFFEQLERMEKQRKDEQEREILLKAAKVHVCVYRTYVHGCMCIY